MPEYVKFTEDMIKTHTILIPDMLPVHFKLFISMFEQYGYHMELLETTSQRVYLISDAVGYRSMEHFMRLFKRETGLTPKAYRIQRQGISTEEDDQNA